MGITDKQFAAAVERFPIVACWGRKGVQELADILNAEHEEALRGLMALIEAGALIRDTSHDAEPGWAIKQIGFVQVLARAKSALERE